MSRYAGVLVLVALLAGCGGTDGPTANPNGRQTPSSAAPPVPAFSASPRPTPSSTGSPSPSASPSGEDDEPSITVTDYTGFASPSGNILCAVDPENSYVRCDIVEKEWESPPPPAECEFDYGLGFDLEEGGAQFSCVSDAIGEVDLTLDYGQSLGAGEILCESAETGMTCTHTGSEKGFTLARADYALF